MVVDFYVVVDFTGGISLWLCFGVMFSFDLVLSACSVGMYCFDCFSF